MQGRVEENREVLVWRVRQSASAERAHPPSGER